MKNEEPQPSASELRKFIARNTIKNVFNNEVNDYTLSEKERKDIMLKNRLNGWTPERIRMAKGEILFWKEK